MLASDTKIWTPLPQWMPTNVKDSKDPAPAHRLSPHLSTQAAAGHLKAVSLLLRWMVGLGHKLLGLSDYSSTSYRRRARELNARTRRGVTPLMLAVGSWDPATLALLLDDFANMGQRRCRRNTSNPVESSADRPLLDPGLRNAAGADVRRVAEQGEMSLHQAAGQKEQEGSLMVMELLLRAGASVQDVDNDGWSPLHIAAARGSEGELSSLLLASRNVVGISNGHRSFTMLNHSPLSKCLQQTRVTWHIALPSHLSPYFPP